MLARILVVVGALAMVVLSYASNLEVFGPSNKTVSDRYPTLLIAAGYAFSIWGVIFLFDLIYAVRQLVGKARQDASLQRIAPWAAGGFVLTAAWSPFFSIEAFWACLAIMFGALGCMITAAFLAAKLKAPRLVRVALSLHAGWLCLAAFLNLAQTVVAYELLPPPILWWSLALYAAAAVLLLVANHRFGGSIAFAVAGVWALVAVFVKQRGWDVPGSNVAAWVALGVAGVLASQTAILVIRGRRPEAMGPPVAKPAQLD